MGSVPVTLAAGVLTLYLVVGVPLSGLLARRELQRGLTREPGLRPMVYRHTMRHLWLLAGLAIGAAGVAKVPLTSLGLRLPSMNDASRPGFLAGAALLVASVTTLVSLALGKVGPVGQTLLPRTREEQRLYVGVAASAGAVEELLFRGFVMAYLTGALGWSVPSAAATSAVAFGISHLYQGPGTALAAGFIGYGFAETYALTGSLLLPVVVHLALDLRVLRTRDETRQKCSASEMQRGEQALEPVT